MISIKQPQVGPPGGIPEEGIVFIGSQFHAYYYQWRPSGGTRYESGRHWNWWCWHCVGLG